MKSIAFLLFAFLFPYYLFGQSGPLPAQSGSTDPGTSMAPTWVYSIYPAAYSLTEYQYDDQTEKWNRVDSFQFDYDALNRLHQYLFFMRTDPSASYNPLSRFTYTYGGNDSIVLEEIETWNNGSWSASSRKIFSYNAMNMMDTMTNQSYKNGQWESSYRITWLYTSSGEDSITTNYQNENGVLEPINQSRATVLVPGQEVFYDYYKWVNGQWVLIGGSEFRYDVQGNLIDRMSLDLDTTTMVWDSTRRDIRTYNGQSDLLSFTQFEDDPNGTGLQEDYTIDFSYISPGMADQRLKSYYDPAQMSYFRYALDTMLYFGTDSSITYTYTWHDTSTTRKKWLQTLREFDDQERLIRELRSSWDPSQNAFVPGIQGHIVYLDQLSGLENEIEATDWIHVYPNPASDRLTLSLTEPLVVPCTLEVFNLTGQIIHRSNIGPGMKETSISGLDTWGPGSYIINLRAGEKEFISKFQVH